MSVLHLFSNFITGTGIICRPTAFKFLDAINCAVKDKLTSYKSYTLNKQQQNFY